MSTVVAVLSDEIVVSSSTGSTTISHGRNGIPCFLPYVELSSGEWYLATSLVKNLARFITIKAECDDSDVVFSVMSGDDATYDLKLIILDEMISGTGDDADDSEDIGIIISSPGSEASQSLEDKSRSFYSGQVHFQPYITKTLSISIGSGDDIDFDSESHGFSFPPVFTGRYRFKYPDYGNTWSEWLLITRTPSDSSDFGMQVYATSSDIKMSVNQNAGVSGANIDVEAQVMLYPIDLSV